MVRVTNGLSHNQRILSQRTLTLTHQIKNLTQPNLTKQTKQTNKPSGAYCVLHSLQQHTNQIACSRRTWGSRGGGERGGSRAVLKRPGLQGGCGCWSCGEAREGGGRRIKQRPTVFDQKQLASTKTSLAQKQGHGTPTPRSARLGAHWQAGPRAVGRREQRRQDRGARGGADPPEVQARHDASTSSSTAFTRWFLVR